MTNKQQASSADIERWIAIAAAAADDKKGVDTVALRIGDYLGITEAFVITSAGNSRLVKTIADEVEKHVKASGGPSPRRVDGLAKAEWVLIDYGDFVVHVFLDETREFYDLERLWRDAPRIDWRAVIEGESAAAEA